MPTWLRTNSSTRALAQSSRSRVSLLRQKHALRGARRGLALAAGRVAIFVAVAVDAYEIYGYLRDYQRGNLSQRGLVIAMSRSGGGIAGAWGGATGGAWIGAKVGLLGGPWAWVTVPAGSIVGGAVGGIAGYFAGSHVGELTAQAWYGSLDVEVRTAVNQWHMHAAAPVLY